MKKITLLLLFWISGVTAQVSNGNEMFSDYGFRSDPTRLQIPATVNFLSTIGTDGTFGKITPVNVTIPTVPVNYSVSSSTLGAHLSGIDTRLGQISSTSAGLTQRVYFTADNTVVNAVTYFASNALNKGVTATGLPPVLVLGDNTKAYFTKDVISVAQPSPTIGYAGTYSGNLTVSASPAPNATQQRFTLEIYRTNNLGVPIASGVAGAPTGDLGVTVVAILDSGIVNLTAGSISNVSVSGVLTQNITINTGERLRYHVSAAKIGTGGGNVTFGVYYGNSYNSYYDVPVAITTDAVLNKSTVTGVTDTDALNSLNTLKENISNKAISFSLINDVLYPTTKATIGLVKTQGFNVSSNPVLLDQFVTSFYGRGMLDTETINLTTEEFISSNSAKGDNVINVANPSNFKLGSTIVVYHSDGTYYPYLVYQNSGTAISLSPSLRSSVSGGISRLERAWYNKAHPGKFYMRYLAQRIARGNEIYESVVSNGRYLYSDTKGTSAENSLIPISGASVSYFSASNTGESGDSQSAVRFPFEKTAFVSYTSIGQGAETNFFDTEGAKEAVLSAVISYSSTATNNSLVIQVLNSDNVVIAEQNLEKQNLSIKKYFVPFNIGNSKSIKVRILVNSLTASGAVMISNIDVYDTPKNIGKIITGKNSKIVGFGDSWVAGDVISTPERESFLTQLAIELPNATIVNKGVGGNNVINLLDRFDIDVAPEKPDYVIVNTGTNDSYNPCSGVFFPNSVDCFNKNMKQLIAKILSINAKPIIIGVPALAQSDTSYSPFQLNDRARQYVQNFQLSMSSAPFVNKYLKVGKIDAISLNVSNMSGTQTEIVVADLNGNISKGGAAPMSGNFTPTISSLSNISAVSSVTGKYIKVGTTVSYTVDILSATVTTASSITSFITSFPFPIKASSTPGGTAVMSHNVSQDFVSGIVRTDQLTFKPNQTGNYRIVMQIIYETN